MNKKRRRFGDRKDGRRVRTLNPMATVVPFIMKTRNDSLNMMSDTVDATVIQKYVNEKKKEGLAGFSIMYVIIAAYIRAISQRPAVNRFVSGQRVFSRDYVEIALTIKKDMTIESPDTVIKVVLPRDATAYDVYETFEKTIKDYRETPGGDFDKTANFLAHMPRLIFRFAIGFLNFLDYFGWLPRKLTDISPFHASMFITSMGSLGVPAVYHHLYNFGNVPIFISFGKKKYVNKLLDDGTVLRVPMLDVRFVMDERICDGYYFASAWKYMRTLFKNPKVLDTKPEKVIEDID